MQNPSLLSARLWNVEQFLDCLNLKNKLGKKRIECVFFGYTLHSKAYRFLAAESNDIILINTIIESRDVVFYENKFDIILRLKSSKVLKV